MGQRYLEEGMRKKAEQSALRLWRLNETLFAAYPHYLAASGAPVRGALPGIGMHTELELLVRMGRVRARLWPPPLIITACNSAGMNLASSAPDAARIYSSLTAIQQRTSGMPGVSPASSWTAIGLTVYVS